MALPKRLNKEPLIDAVFEIRFDSSAPVSVIVPGFLFEKLEGEKTIKELAAAQMPKALREANPSMKYSPLSRINWGVFNINISDSSLLISCKYPYPGWTKFKSAIYTVILKLSELSIIKSVVRYSIKYVDLLPAADIKQQITMAKLELVIAGHKLDKEFIQIRIEIPKEEFTNIIQLSATANVTVEGVLRSGLAVDVDTITSEGSTKMEELLDQFEAKLDRIHYINKSMFFDCITPETIESLEPVYE